MNIHCLAVTCFAAAYLIPVARGDDLPANKLASGQPETILAGIDLRTSTLDDVIRMYGPPTRQTKAPKEPQWTGYVWQLPGARLELGVFGESGDMQIGDIYVEGVSRQTVGTTGRGLRLGDDERVLRRLYGSKLLKWSGKAPSEVRQEFGGVQSRQRIYLQWASEDFKLGAGFDSSGKIEALWLMAP